jgi:hypothetical protein
MHCWMIAKIVVDLQDQQFVMTLNLSEQCQSSLAAN